MLEKELEAKIVRYAKARGCLVYKFSSPSHSGVCDRIIIAPGGRVMFMELKAPGQVPTPLQYKFLVDVTKQGATGVWADNEALGRFLIDLLFP